MPLYKTITVNPSTKVLIWKIEESFEELFNEITLTERSLARVRKMKSELHQRGFLSIRYLLASEGYTDHDLYYDENGKPHLTDGKHISITHSFTFSAIIISDIEVGIDIEKKREKILKIAHKFTEVDEYQKLNHKDVIIRKLTIVWCAKESLYKSFNRVGLTFLNHISVEDFSMYYNETTAEVNFEDKTEKYKIWFLEFEGFTCAYALLNERKKND
ncbi:MAG: 4-phosphopantetheinyl transferase [Flavobacterium sp.]|nr:MAG: 4-phosphopantetheinyl transferase [Flavobacterium sp.]